MSESPAPSARDRISSVLIVDDHPLYSDALADALDLMFPGCEIRKAGTFAETIRVLDRRFEPDLVMFDLKLPDVRGISGFCDLRERLPEALVLVISALASVELVQTLIDKGANGFLPKDAPAPKLRAALDKIIAGGAYVPPAYRPAKNATAPCEIETYDHPTLAVLTPQQRRIMKLISTGMPNKQIAYELSLAEATVKAHITALLRRLGVRNRTQAVVLVESVMAEQGGSEPEVRAFLSH